MTSVGKDYVFTLVLVHIVRFGSITQSLWYWYTYPSGYCCGAGAGHLGTEAVLLLQSKLFRVMCGVTKILQEL